MNYLQAWREGHEAGMHLCLQLINEFSGQDFKTASEVVLHIKDLENQCEEAFYSSSTPSDKEEQMMDSLAQKIAIQNYLWKD